MEDLKIKIGLETHVQLETISKLFCGCKIDSNANPNTLTCPTCLGFPGSKPRINKKAFEFAIKVALALNCSINKEFFFSRKTYFYPDMSKNFQITQYEIPLAKRGFLLVNSKKINITRVHIEEDPAKLIHPEGMKNSQFVLADYNRAGTPLIEIVTDPDLKTPQEARIYLQKLTAILEYLGVYNSLGEASLKTDLNVSIMGGQKVEIKNVTSFRDAEKALTYEILRQKNLMRTGKTPEQETRAYDPATGTTWSMRTKETEEDYGYIFEPDLTSFEITEKEIGNIQRSIPELPDQKIDKYVKIGLNHATAESIASELKLSELFETLGKKFTYPQVASWLLIYMKTLNYHKIQAKDIEIDIEGLITLLHNKKITEHSGETLLRELVKKALEKKNQKAEITAAEMGLLRIESEVGLENIVKKVIRENSKAIEDFRKGEEKALHFLVGQVMKESKGMAEVKEVNEILKKKIKF